jgi:hypothetical protein
MAYFKHYKTGKIYRLIGFARHSETEEELVIYESSTGGMWARPKKMFFETVQHEGREVPRFEKVINKPEDNPCGEIDLLPRC